MLSVLMSLSGWVEVITGVACFLARCRDVDELAQIAEQRVLAEPNTIFATNEFIDE